MRSRVPGLLLLGLFLAAPQALAWGEDGHRIVCRIAYLLLDEADQATVQRATEAYERPDGSQFQFYTDGCVFPDEARSKAKNGTPGYEKFNQFNNWHFLNVPRATLQVRAEDCANDCVLEGIRFHSAAVASASNDQERGEALFFLGHWFGDIHQPLHISFADDLGGNSVKPITGGFYRSANLHSVWDSGIIKNAEGDDGWRAYADNLKDAITPADQATWIASGSVDWAQESYLITTGPDVRYCEWDADSCNSITGGRKLLESYQDEFADEVEVRLQKAGVRLAEQIRKSLHGQ